MTDLKPVDLLGGADTGDAGRSSPRRKDWVTDERRARS